MTGGPTLGALAAQAARKFSERTCLVYEERRWTYCEVDALANALSASLSARLPAGARVGLFMANRPEYVFLQLALERAGLVRVPLNARSSAREVKAILEDCAAEALFFDRATSSRAAAVFTGIPRLWICEVDGKDAANGPAWREISEERALATVTHAANADSLCSINYTSGTSGRPKGVMLTHRNWASTYRNMLVDRDIRADDVLAHVGPLTHSSGAYFLAWFLRGACSVIVEGSTVDGLLDAIERRRVTVFTCVPTLLTRIVNHPQVDRRDLSSLRAIGYGAEPIPSNTLEKALRRFGPILTQNYGLTEAMMTVTTLRPEEHFRADGGLRIGCIGRPYTFVEVVVRRVDGSIAASGEVGEITIRSEHLMSGYWNSPSETARVLREGWLWSGDLAVCDEDGYITLAGRNKDMLISGGFNIYPQEVEALLTSHPQVVEAAVIGVPDAQWGEKVVAFVSVLPGSPRDAAGLTAYCKPVLGFKTPKAFNFMERLPRNVNGKIDKSVLKAAASSAGAGSHDA